jgi:glycerate kinase
VLTGVLEAARTRGVRIAVIAGRRRAPPAALRSAGIHYTAALAEESENDADAMRAAAERLARRSANGRQRLARQPVHPAGR